jgi:hypothetical protein
VFVSNGAQSSLLNWAPLSDHCTGQEDLGAGSLLRKGHVVSKIIMLFLFPICMGACKIQDQCYTIDLLECSCICP